MMRRALVEDLLAIPGIEVSTMRDARLATDTPTHAFTVHAVGDFRGVFREAAQGCDAIWPIAPESGQALLRTTAESLACGCRLLGSRPDAVEIASSKRSTAEVLARAGIAAVPCYASELEIPEQLNWIVLKPDDGAGCRDTRLFRNRSALLEWLQDGKSAGQILQPYVHGDARSLSLICCGGKSRLLACNRQNIRIEQGVFHFEGVSINAIVDRRNEYARLADGIAAALPGLWGYVGVDFLETAGGPVVVEVNPRLTMSYVGLRAAIGTNPAELVMGLTDTASADAECAGVNVSETGVADGI
jgi:predicted ATP-grasp superfamily ATP-dependent carboligase